MKLWRFYWNVFLSFLKSSIMTSYEYRANFVIKLAVHVTWTTVQVMFVSLIFTSVKSINGWSQYEMLLLLGINQIIYCLFFGIVLSSLSKLEEYIVNGNMDYVILKPVHSRFYMTFRNIDIFQLIPILYGIAIILYAGRKLNIDISISTGCASVLLMIAGVWLLSSLYVISASFSFKYQKANALNNIVLSFVECMAYPLDIYKGFFRILITVVIPIGIIVDFPSRIVVKSLSYPNLFYLIFIAVFFSLISNFMWKRGIQKYTSASS